MTFTPSNQLTIRKARIKNMEHLTKHIHNQHGLDIRITGANHPNADEDHFLGFIIVESELKHDLKGRWGRISWDDFKAGLLDTLSSEIIEAHLKEAQRHYVV